MVDSDKRRERDERAERRNRLRSWLSRCEAGEDAEAAMAWTYGVAASDSRTRWLRDSAPRLAMADSASPISPSDPERKGVRQ